MQMAFHAVFLYLDMKPVYKPEVLIAQADKKFDKTGEYRIYSRKKNPKTNKRKNLGTFSSLEAAKKHEKEIQYFKRH